MRIPGRERGFELQPCGRDLFQTEGGEAFAFERDANEAIAGFTFASNAAWSLRFARVKR